MKPSPSLAGRAMVAVALMIGFYLLAIGIACGLLYIPYAEWVYTHRVHIKLLLFCVLGGLAILWAVIPRPDRFEAPGPQLIREENPLLFQEIESVAKAVNQQMPKEVFLVPDVNAWVAQRGGIMGFGSFRVMGLGLPLMRILTRSQFRAVLAHEFGHYHGGDTQLGPWIYKTRAAIGRTLQSLGDGSWLQLPFLWYGKMFLRITHAVSRRQEFVADELAARTIGSQALIGGLRTIHGVAPVFGAYWSSECVPVLSAGFRPPLTEGFQRFVKAAPVAAVIEKGVEEELKSAKSDPYDTHPPLRERVSAVEHIPAGDPGPEDPPAITLLGDVAGLENQMLSGMISAANAERLKPVTWEDVTSEVYLPQWKALIESNASALTGVTTMSLPASLAALQSFGSRLRRMNGETPDKEEAEALACAVIGSALTLLLLNRGAKLSAAPGEPLTVGLGDAVIEPFGVLRSLVGGKLAPEDWQNQCRTLGIEEVNLSEAAAKLEPGATPAPKDLQPAN